MRRCTLLKAQQAHIELMSLLQVVAALESRRNCEQDPAEHKCMKKELNALRVKRDKTQHHQDCQQQIIECCEEDLVLLGELKCTATSGGTPLDAPTSTASEETAEAPIEASGSTPGMPPLEEDMKVGGVHSPIRTAEDKLLDKPQAQEAGDMPRETSEEADPNTTPTRGETPSTGVTAGLSKLSVSLPRAQPTPESTEGPTTSTPQGPASDTAPPMAE